MFHVFARTQPQEDLAVHRQKVEQVSHWLSEAFGVSNGGKLRKYRVSCSPIPCIRFTNDATLQRVLALTGPSGVGKSATIRILAQDMGIQIIEWRNALDDWKMGDLDDASDGMFASANPSVCGECDLRYSYSTIDKLSLSRKFDQFLSRGNAYSSLSFASTSTAPTFSAKRLILIEDILNIQNPTVKEAFHAALGRFVDNAGEMTCPLAIIISDAGIRAEGSASDGYSSWKTRQSETMDFRTVFPKDLQNSPLVAQIQ